MREFELTHLSDTALLRELAALISLERMTTATLLAHLAEVDTRRLYAPSGYASMFAYCVGALRLSEDAAYKRIQAARAGRQFPSLFHELSNGRLHLAAVCLLAPHLTPENAGELIAAAANRKKSEVEGWLARRFMDSGTPPSSPSTIRRVMPQIRNAGPAMDDLLNLSPPSAEDLNAELAPGQVGQGPASSIVGAPDAQNSGRPHDPNEVQPQAVERFEVRVTIDKATYERLRYVQSLMSHAIPDGDLGQILGRAVEALIHVAERRKFGGRQVPRHVKPEERVP